MPLNLQNLPPTKGGQSTTYLVTIPTQPFPIVGFIGPREYFGSWDDEGTSADGVMENDLAVM